MNRDQFREKIMAGDAEGIEALTRTALDEGSLPADIINTCMIPVMEEVGQLFEEGELYIPEMIMSAGAMQAGMTILRPMLVGDEAKTAGSVVIGTVEGDMHDIGKTLVGTLMEAAGFEVHDIGVDVAPDRFIEAVQTRNPRIVAMSAMLTTTMPAMGHTIDALKEAGLRESLIVMVGGAPLTPDFAQSIGADGYAEDAADAARLARELAARMSA
jgi:5-methyltetrahydrofolate--homocysteine methyltransferase